MNIFYFVNYIRNNKYIQQGHAVVVIVVAHTTISDTTKKKKKWNITVRFIKIIKTLTCLFVL